MRRFLVITAGCIVLFGVGIWCLLSQDDWEANSDQHSSYTLYDYDVKVAEPIIGDTMRLDGLAQIDGLISLDNNEIFFWRLDKKGQYEVVNYSIAQECEKIIYRSKRMNEITDAVLCGKDIVICQALPFDGSNASFEVLRIDLAGNCSELYADSCCYMPEIGVGGDAQLVIGYQKNENGALKSELLLYDSNNETVSEIASAEAQIGEDNKYNGECLLYTSANSENCCFQVLDISGCENFERASLIRIEEFNFETEEISSIGIYYDCRPYVFFTKYGGLCVGSNLYYDIPESDPETSWIQDYESETRIYLPGTQIAYELTGCYQFQDYLVAYNHTNYYVINPLNPIILYCDIPIGDYDDIFFYATEDGYYYLTLDGNEWELHSWDDFSILYNYQYEAYAINQENIKASEELLYCADVNGIPIDSSGMVYTNESKISLTFRPLQETDESLEWDLDGNLENHVLSVSKPFRIIRYDGTVTFASVYEMDNLKPGEQIVICLSDQLKDALGMRTSKIIIVCK